jgi:hypothetical protein
VSMRKQYAKLRCATLIFSVSIRCVIVLMYGMCGRMPVLKPIVCYHHMQRYPLCCKTCPATHTTHALLGALGMHANALVFFDICCIFCAYLRRFPSTFKYSTLLHFCPPPCTSMPHVQVL